MAIRFWELYEENREKFQLKIVAGKAGMDTVVSWVHMLEDETIVSRFNGEELAITTGMKTNHPDWLFHLVKQMHLAECAGIIINTGMYIFEIPKEVTEWCEEHRFPVLVMPWDKSITYLIQNFCMRIIDQEQYEKKIGETLMKAMTGIGNKQEYDKVLRNVYEIEGTFQVICIYAKKIKEDELQYTQALFKLENVFGIWKDTKKIITTYGVLQVEDYIVLVLNNMQDHIIRELPTLIRQSFQYFDDNKRLFLGLGPKIEQIENLQVSYKRARIAMKMAIGSDKRFVDFDSMGVYKILYSVEDVEILQSYANQMLGPVIQYDSEHHADYLTTLRSYIKNDRSLIGVADETFTHRNTVNYRIQNMKKLLNNELKSASDLFPYEVAFMILDMIHKKVNV